MKRRVFDFGFRSVLMLLMPVVVFAQSSGSGSSVSFPPGSGQNSGTVPPPPTTPPLTLTPGAGKTVVAEPKPYSPPQGASPVTPGASSAAPLINISTRISLTAGQILTSGFVVGGNVPRRVLIRAVGPTLAAFGISHPLADPQISVFSEQALIAKNDDWGGDATMAALFAAIGAFALAPTSLDSAVVVTLSPGSYSAQVSSVVSSGAGEVLLEIYFVD